MQQRLFTLDEARALLPWLEEKFAQMEPYRHEVERCQARTGELLLKSRSNGHGRSVEEELQRMQALVQELQSGIQDILSQITGRGIVVRDVDRGLVDFPSMREGRTVDLCWLRGEVDINFWHETDAGFAGRQPL